MDGGWYDEPTDGHGGATDGGGHEERSTDGHGGAMGGVRDGTISRSGEQPGCLEFKGGPPLLAPPRRERDDIMCSFVASSFQSELVWPG